MKLLKILKINSKISKEDRKRVAPILSPQDILRYEYSAENSKPVHERRERSSQDLNKEYSEIFNNEYADTASLYDAEYGDDSGDIGDPTRHERTQSLPTELENVNPANYRVNDINKKLMMMQQRQVPKEIQRKLLPKRSIQMLALEMKESRNEK